jgi:hypothetical protein
MAKKILIITQARLPYGDHLVAFSLLAKEDATPKMITNAVIAREEIASRRHRRVKDTLLTRTFASVADAKEAARKFGLEAITYQKLSALARAAYVQTQGLD